jgi:hypothetical protein
MLGKKRQAAAVARFDGVDISGVFWHAEHNA